MNIQKLFFNTKAPVITSVVELEEFLKKYPEYNFCLYLAHKDKDGWEKSTSRVYMNKVLPDLIYLPVDVEKDDLDSLRQVYKIAENNKQILAINQTQPHKSNPIIKEMFKGFVNIPTNIDAIVKDKDEKLIPYDLNGPSFMGWYKEEVGSFCGKNVVLIGVGGVGEPIARSIIKEKPNKLILIDPVDKKHLESELSHHGLIIYYRNLEDIDEGTLRSNIIVVNCAGKEGAADQAGLHNLIARFKDKGYIFIDLRPHLKIEIVELAKKSRWKSYTGYGMNARNDYTLLQKIAELLNQQLPKFEVFQRLVKEAS